MKNKNILSVTTLVIMLFLSSCSTTPNSFLEFYNDEGLLDSEYVKIKDDEEIILIETTNLNKKLSEYYKKGYVALGFSQFTGWWCPRAMAIDTAREKGASIVVISSDFLGTMEYKYSIPVSTSHTTYHQGTISSNTYTTGHIQSTSGNIGANYNAITTGNSHYSGTSTYYTTSYIDNNLYVNFFEQIAVFLAKKAEGIVND